jgi:hypothetical protein
MKALRHFFDVALLAAAVLATVACGAPSDSHVPNPDDLGGTVLARGDDRGPYEVVGFNRSYPEIISEYRVMFENHSWLIRTVATDLATYQFVAVSPNGAICASYFDLLSGGPFAPGLIHKAEMEHPGITSRFGEFETVVYASAGYCA